MPQKLERILSDRRWVAVSELVRLRLLGAFLASQTLFGAPVDVGLTDPVPQA
jgi:hypothetical protein